MKYRIEWQSRHTGKTGHGEWFEDVNLLNDWVRKAQAEFGKDVDHWIADENGHIRW